MTRGFGISMNLENGLIDKTSFASRIDIYSGSTKHRNLEEILLTTLADSDEKLKRHILNKLRQTEKLLADARSQPLLTEMSSETGLSAFVELCAVPWFATLIADASWKNNSLIYYIGCLLEEHACSDNARYLDTWRYSIKRALPKGADTTEFRSILDRIEEKTQRKISSVEEDMMNLTDVLREHLQRFDSEKFDLEKCVKKIRNLYLAGMATMRFSLLAKKASLIQDPVTLLINRFRSGPGSFLSSEGLDRFLLKSDERVDRDQKMLTTQIEIFRQKVESRPLQESMQRLCQPFEHFWDESRFQLMLSDAKKGTALSIYEPYLNFAVGTFHLGLGRIDKASIFLKRVISFSDDRQLGWIGSIAATLLIALRISDSQIKKFEELNPLVKIRIESIEQDVELQAEVFPTPFSDYSNLPKLSIYDSHILSSLVYLKSFPRAPGVLLTTNPLKRFDDDLQAFFEEARILGARLTPKKANRSAIAGTSIKPYEVLVYKLYYLMKLDQMELTDLPFLMRFQKLLRCEQLRMLRYIDQDKFIQDIKLYDLVGWCHPEDPVKIMLWMSRKPDILSEKPCPEFTFRLRKEIEEELGWDSYFQKNRKN